MQGIIVLIVYALLMVGATKAFTKREDGGESFHVGHRNMGISMSFNHAIIFCGVLLIRIYYRIVRNRT